jgi:hypothetical protein
MNIEKKKKLGEATEYHIIRYIILDTISKTPYGTDIISNDNGITFPLNLNIEMYIEIIDECKGKNTRVEFIHYDNKWIMFHRKEMISSTNFSFEILIAILERFTVKFYIDEFESTLRHPVSETDIKCLRKDLYIQTFDEEGKLEYKANWFSHSTPASCQMLYDQFLKQVSDTLDFTIETSDMKTIKVHKQLLSFSSSDYLKTLLESTFSETITNNIKLDYSYDVIMFYLKFLYMGDTCLIHTYKEGLIDMKSCLSFGDYFQDLLYFNTCVRIVENDHKYTNFLWSMKDKMNHNSVFQSFIQENIKIRCESGDIEESSRSKLSELLRDKSSELEFELFGIYQYGFTSIFRYRMMLTNNTNVDVLIINNIGKPIVEFIVTSEIYIDEVTSEIYIDEVTNKMILLFKKDVTLYRNDKIPKLMKTIEILLIEIKLEMTLRQESKLTDSKTSTLCSGCGKHDDNC